MTPETYAYIQSLSRPLEPIPTEVAPQPGELTGIRAVLFDIYGTLLISSSGDLGTLPESAGDHFQATLEFAGMLPEHARQYSPNDLEQTIRQHHEAARAEGIEFPEVDMIAVWEELLSAASESTLGQPLELSEEILEAVALRHELHCNPVWPMPHAEDCLQTLRDRNFSLGVISNAQFFTAELFPALLGYDLEDLGFHPALQVFSYQYLEAKPSPALFDAAAVALAEFGISPEETLCVGNDLLKDIWPAARAGFRTALFAGDARSLRLRADDERVNGVRPDLILTDLRQLPDCLEWL